jgi:hypothetical protein
MESGAGKIDALLCFLIDTQASTSSHQVVSYLSPGDYTSCRD